MGPGLCYARSVRRIALLAVPFLFSACPEPPPRVGATLDLTRPASEPAPRVPLAPVPLRTQGDFDTLEERYAARRDPTTLFTALEKLAATARPAENPEDALLLMRLGVLYRDRDAGARGAGYLQKALAIGTRLRAEAPASPHTLFLQGYIPFAFLGGAADRPMAVTADTREFATACLEQWRQLLAMVPDYAGPARLDNALIKRTVAALERAIPTSAAPVPEVPPAVATPVGKNEVLAMRLFARFEASSEGDRRGLCRDWEPSIKEGAARTAGELRLDLACATMSGQVERAAPMIARLRDLEGPAFSPCLAAVRLRERADRAKVDLALGAVGLTCP